MENNKPVIFIYTCSPFCEIMDEIAAGMEEEGVLFKIVECRAEDSAETLALKAAKASMLEAGVGIKDKDLCFNQLSLKSSKPILNLKNADKKAARKFGSNAAKFIKGCSLKI